MLVVYLVITWLVFLALQWITSDITRNLFLAKNCHWVFVPFITYVMSLQVYKTIYLAFYVYLIYIAFSSRRHSLFGYIQLCSLIAFSFYSILMLTPIFKLFV